LHGQHEFGKDFVFAELTPFGFMKYHAAVVKHEEKVGQSNSKLVEGILSQIRQAFTKDFYLPESAVKQRVSSVCLFNSGKISDNAKEVFRTDFKDRFGDNVHIFDGERLNQLDLTSSFQAGQSFLPRLQGLRQQIRLTMLVWESIVESLPQFGEGRGSFTRAIEDYLAAPFLTPPLNYDDFNLLIQQCRIIDSINSRYLHGGLRTPEVRERDTEKISMTIANAQPVAAKILGVIERTRAQFVPISQSSFGIRITEPANGSEWKQKRCQIKGTFERRPGNNVIAVTNIGNDWWPQPWPIRITEPNQWSIVVDFGVTVEHKIYIVRVNEATFQLIRFYHEMVIERVKVIDRVTEKFNLDGEEVRQTVSPIHWSLKLHRLPDGLEPEDSITLDVTDLQLEQVQ
jgi:hypothetical protein